MYWLSSRIAKRTWFQNPDDMAYFLDKRLISSDRPVLILSSGINIQHWRKKSEDRSKNLEVRKALGLEQYNVVVMTVSRALRNKGVLEFIKAADWLSSKYINVRFLSFEAAIRGTKRLIVYVKSKL